jgi:leader peptidase (prepilin peptidase)/N-methyltransferase
MALPPDEVLEPLLTGAGAYVVVFVLGTLFGSFANVCIYRWPPSDAFPTGCSVVRPGSHCGACGKPVRWFDNVPIVAWLWLRGRCRDCGARFSARYLLVEAATAILFVATWHLCLEVGWFWQRRALHKGS